MENSQTRFGKLTLNYIDKNDHYCVCDCGIRIILTKEQLDKNRHCGCEYRKYLLALSGKEDDKHELEQTQTTTYSENRGVNFEKNKWRARITFQTKVYHLGYFSSKEAAIEMRKEAEHNLNNNNFIEWYNQRH